MPGLLQSPEGNFGSAKVIYALVAEFLGTMLFTFAGTVTPASGEADSGANNWAPW